MTKKTIDLEARTVTWTFDDETTAVFELDRVSEEMRTQLALHGASQKGGDTYAGAQKAVEGMDISVLDYTKTVVAEAIKQLYAGDWSIRTGLGGPQITDLAVALAEVYSVEPSIAAKKVSEMDPDQKKAARAAPQIKAVLDRIRAERAAAKAAESAAGAEEAPLPDLGF